MMVKFGPSVVFILINSIFGAVSAQYYGKFIGKLSELHHGVSGEVYAVDGRTLYLKDFTYDGQGPAAYFYASTGRNANSAGFRLRDENGSPKVIRRYRKEGITLTLPEGKNLNNIKIFYVWCEEFDVNFGDVKIPRNFDYPRPQKIDALKGVHAISSDNIVIVDAQTLLIPNLSYDGEAPDAKFWVGRGPKPSPQGIRVPDENGKEVPLRRYDRKTVVLTLPGDLTVFDIGHFGIWCEAFTVDFGHVQIPTNMNVPPSLKMLGISPQSKLNCEVLYDDLAFEVRWAVAGDSIVLQLVAKLDDREYMSFGISGDDTKTSMIGGDVVVAWVDKDTLKGYADDYYLDAKSQCSGPSGSCPDIRLSDNTNNIRLLNAAMVNGYSIVTYQRPLKPSDQYDRQIFTNHSQPIIWAIGPLNQRNEVSFHSHYTKGDQFIDFGRPANWNCPMPESEQPPMKPVPQIKEEVVTQPSTTTTTTIASRSRNSERRRGNNNRRQETTTEAATTRATNSRSRTRNGNRNSDRVVQRGSANIAKTVPTPAPVTKRDAWEIPPIQCYEPDDGVFYAQMGPTGGKRGYPAITGHVGWGISWYINGLLIPEINVVRGKTYTFVVEGGYDPDVAAKYHPFYITDDPVGGYEYKTEEEKKNVTIFAGAILGKDGTVTPTGTGRLCHWTHQGDSDADDFESFGAYQRTLELKCDQGEPGVIQWTPDKNTPDTVYYQCFTHRYLGWKINVHDHCDLQPAGSEQQEIIVVAPENLENNPSTDTETRVKFHNAEDFFKDDKNKSIVSEMIPVTDPSEPNRQLPKVPILTFQTPPNYFNPSVLMNSHGSFFTTNPFIFKQPFYLQSYQQQTFKPSSLIMAESQVSTNSTISSTITTTISPISFDTSSISISSIPTFSTTTTTTSTTASTLIPSAPSQQITKHKKFETIKKHKFSGQLLASPSEIKTHNQSYHALAQPPHSMRKKNNNFIQFVARRPGPGLHPNTLTIMKPPRPVPVRYIQHPLNPYNKKKPILLKNQNRPIPHHYIKNNKNNINNNNKLKVSETNKFNNIVLTTTALPSPPPPPPPPKHIEISPPQISTEKNIATTLNQTEIFSKDYFKNFFNAPFNLQFQSSSNNNGFHPESVVIESGFKPITSAPSIQRRISEGIVEVESKKGYIDRDSPNEKPSIIFEPIFVPSPIDKPIKHKLKRPYIKKIIIKHPRSLDEPIAEAAERVESFYLPPSGQPPKIKLEASQVEIGPPPKIDLASPPEIVVSYDGKRVSGASLTAKVDRPSSILDGKSSKATELIKARPQFAPFKGELPPLNLENVNMNAPQLQPSTKLSAVKVDKKQKRRRREAHHTPEHTAEQEKLKKQNQTEESMTSKSEGLKLVKSNLHLLLFGTILILNFI